VGIAAAIVIFAGHMSVTIVLWPVHVFKTYNTVARLVLVTLFNFGVAILLMLDIESSVSRATNRTLYCD